jgi:IS30 family transposase
MPDRQLKRPDASLPRKWGRKHRSHEDRKQIAAWYILGVPLREIARRMDVNDSAAEAWPKRDWWPEYIQDAQECLDGQRTARYRDIIDRAQAEILERIENGDERLARDGSVRRLKVGAKDLAVIGSIAYQSLRLAEGKPNRITADLSQLAVAQAQLRQIAQSVVSTQGVGQSGPIEAEAEPCQQTHQEAR